MKILVVDDEPTVRELLKAMIESLGHQVDEADCGWEALELLRRGSYDVVFSDFSMPAMNGMELLGAILLLDPNAAVVMLTGAGGVPLAVSALKRGAADYCEKPFRLERIEEALATAGESRRTRRQLHALLEAQAESTSRLEVALRERSEKSLLSLVAALDAREQETQCHSVRVSEYAAYLASAMGFHKQFVETVRRGALLHDIGKIGIPDEILLKSGPLIDSEWAIMQKHPEIGHGILRSMNWLSEESEIVLAHHERFDGGGYPFGKKEEGIPLGARIFSVADCFDAITSDRPYRRARPYSEALVVILTNQGTQFDPAVVAVFREIPGHVWDNIRVRIGEAHRRSWPQPAAVNQKLTLPGLGPIGG